MTGGTDLHVGRDSEDELLGGPKERLIAVMMMQLFPNRDDVNEVFQTLVYSAVLN